MTPEIELLTTLEQELPAKTRTRLDTAVERIVSAKKRAQKVVVIIEFRQDFPELRPP